MCGIAGIIDNHSVKIKSKITKMLESIHHRGPDERKIISSRQYAFGVNRLAIESLKDGQQPIEDEKIIIGFNGEIFNYKELRSQYNLEKSLYNSEVKVLFFLFHKFGPEFTELLEGQFAIFVYIKKSNTIHLFRDRFGIRPLFYFHNRTKLIFCSEIKGILCATDEKPDISSKALAQTALFWTVIGDQTSFDGVSQLPPGSYLTWCDGKVKSVKQRDSLFKNRNNFKDEFNLSILDNLRISIRSQIHGEVPHASYLSGGIDSVAMAYFLQKELNYNLTTYSVEFDNNEYDEAKWQKISHNLIKSNHKYIKIKNTDIANNFSNCVKHAETFLFRTAPVPMYMLSKKVSEDGFKVVFTGEGADEILLGYDIFFESRIRKFWNRDPSSKLRPQLLKRLYHYLPQFKNSRYFSILQDFYKSHLGDPTNVFYSHLVRWAQFKQVSSYFNLDDEKYSASNLLEELLKNLPAEIVEFNHDEKAQEIEFETLLSNYLLSSQGDRMTMANSLEGRYPYLGDEFVKKMALISPNSKASGIKSKKKFRDELSNFLPKEIIERPKVAYQAPEAKAFLSHAHSTEQAEKLRDNLNSLNLINRENFFSLEEKIKMEGSSQRLGFRENMGYVICQSYLELEEMNKK